MPRPKKHLLVCVQNRPPTQQRRACGERGCIGVFQEFSRQFLLQGLHDDFLLSNSGCLGTCAQGPVVLVYPDNVMYGGVEVADVAVIIDQHLLGGVPVQRLLVPAKIW